MDCCSHTCDMSTYFSLEKAQSEASQYFKHGLPAHAQAMLAAVTLHEVRDATVLEVGGGVGSLQIELLKQGAKQATNVESSPAYLTTAQSLAGQVGLADRIRHTLTDFASQSELVTPADIVILHRVVCCYPDMPRLVETAAEHTQRLLAISFPRDTWYTRLFIELQARWLQLRGSRFRNYVHSPEAIVRVATSSGLRPTHQRFSGTWQIMIFERLP